MFGELRGKTGHDFLIWKVKRRAGALVAKTSSNTSKHFVSDIDSRRWWNNLLQDNDIKKK